MGGGRVTGFPMSLTSTARAHPTVLSLSLGIVRLLGGKPAWCLDKVIVVAILGILPPP